MTEAPEIEAYLSQTRPLSMAVAGEQALYRLTELVRASMQTQASLTRQSVDLVWSTVVGGLDRTSANRAYLTAVTRESARYWRTVGELGIYGASDLVVLGKSASATILRAVAAVGRRTAGARRPSDGGGPATESGPR